jgi:hypothetical protein
VRFFFAKIGVDKRYGKWLLKNYFRAYFGQKMVRKSLICRSTSTPNFVEITTLVPFSTATEYYVNRGTVSELRQLGSQAFVD